MDPSELDARRHRRASPVRTNRDDRYFTRSLPKPCRCTASRAMFERILDHPNIKIMLNTEYREVRDFHPPIATNWSTAGPIDEFFDSCYGQAAVIARWTFKFETPRGVGS